MEINASLVKELREVTGAGVMDCKKALVECNGDIDKSIDYLRKKGVSKAAKKADRIAAEGLSNIYINGNEAVVIEVNSETDFVARNNEFKTMVDKIGNTILNSDAKTVEEALQLSVDGITINDLIVSEIATIGEKLSLRRFERVTKNSDEIFGAYLHMGGKISSLVVLKGDNERVAKDVAMQITAMHPEYIDKDSVPADVVEHEKSILKEQALSEGKPQEFVEKIITGRLEKFFAEVCLVLQSFIKDSDLTIRQYLKENSSDVVSFVRYEVGEGMEKRNDNFAEEVRSQLNN